MNFIPEVTSSLRILKPDNSQKDKKQRNFYPESKLALKNTEEEASVSVEIDSKNEDMIEINRRKGEERRKSLIQRGKWLESREKKDRRNEPKLSLSI